MDRIETEPIYKKRESLSSLFRRSKISRGCRSNTSIDPSSPESESLDIVKINNSIETKNISQSSPTEKAVDSRTITESESSSNHNYIATEIEEGIHFTMTTETMEGQDTFESKPSQLTYIDSSEEFTYSDRDIPPGPLNLNLEL